MRSTLALALVAAAMCAAAVPAQDLASPRVGGHSPRLQVAEWLDGQPPFQLYEGRAGVVFFFGTWSGACTDEFARLNALVDAMQGEPITFAAVVDADRVAVEALLREHPLRARVARDDAGKTFHAFGVRAVPKVVLVDPKGKLAALPRLDDVDAATLRRLAQGEEIWVPSAEGEAADLQWDEREDGGFDARQSLAHVVVLPSPATSGGVLFPPGRGRITADGLAFANLVQLAHDVAPDRVVSDHPEYRNLARRYRVSVKAADDRPETAQAMLREQLARQFGFTAEWVDVDVATPVLQRIPGRELNGLQPSHAERPSGSAKAGVVELRKAPIARIVAAVGAVAGKRGLQDRTGLEGEFDFALRWEGGGPDALAGALAECGLRIGEETRKVRKLRVSVKR